jgi:predicted cobalt transporter CbtA
MFTAYLKRGLKAGFVGGVVYGLFVALVGNPLVAFAETFEQGHGAREAVLSATTATATSVAAGVVWGLLLGGLVFGVAYYFLEPAIPGAADTKGYLLAATGFLTVSGAPWLVLPPQPPGVEQALATDARFAWYGLMAVAGGVACGASVAVYNRLGSDWRARQLLGSALPFAVLVALVVVAPANPVSGSVPGAFVAAFRWTVVFGQFLLWLTLASAHAWLVRRERPTGTGEPSVADFDPLSTPE